MHILVKYASRSRPSRFFEGLDSIWSLALDKNNITVYCCVDTDDMTLFEADGRKSQIYKDGMREIFHKYNLANRIFYDEGSSHSKIDAINRPLNREIEWDILVNFSDDMRFTVYGWDEIIREGFRCNGPDRFLHFPDSTAKNMLATMSVMGRKYFERDGYIYHPAYKSLWCDNEAMEVAKMRGCYVYMGTQIFDHYHPAYGHVPWDEQYERQQGFWNEDELTYTYRKLKKFFLNESEIVHPYPYGG